MNSDRLPKVGLTPDGGHLTGGTAGRAGRMSGFNWTTGSGGIKFTGHRNIDSNFGTMSGYQNFTYESPVTTQCGNAYETSTILLEASVIYSRASLAHGTTAVSRRTGVLTRRLAPRLPIRPKRM